MGNFLFRKKKINEQTNSEPEVSFDETLQQGLDKKKVNLSSDLERKDYVVEQCEQIVEARNHLEDTKVEYQAVTAYLTDIQRIDMIPVEERETLYDAARRIINLTRERMKFQNREIKITDRQYKNLEKYEDTIPDDIKKLKKEEEYNKVIKADMGHLEGEKSSLAFDLEETLIKQKYLKALCITTSILVILLFAVFYMFTSVFEANMQIPFLLTVCMAMVVAMVIFFQGNRNRYQLKVAEIKLNKAIGLMNKVKIKYINNQSTLDYAYQKYGVNNMTELAYLWEQYVKAKDDAKRYEKNTELLEFYNGILVEELERFQIKDTEVWLYQPIAIIDNNEMVEVRHRLNLRRQKLREKIEYNSSIISESKNEIQRVIERKPECKEEVMAVLEKYWIEL